MASPRGETRGRKKKTVSDEGLNLLKAMDFVKDCVGSEAPFNHYRIQDKELKASNGVMSAGYPIAPEFELCPRADELRTAVEKCGLKLAMTVTDKGSLSIKGEKLTATVRCLPFPDMPPITADAAQQQADFEAIKSAFKVCAVLATETGTRMVETSLLLHGTTCAGTNGKSVLQVYHGLNMPPGVVVSKSFAMAVARKDEKITGLGFGFTQVEIDLMGEGGERQREWVPSTMTVHFEGGGWISTQCYLDRWPTETIDRLFQEPFSCAATPEGLLEAIETVSVFNDSGTVYLSDDKVHSAPNPNAGTFAEVKGLQAKKQIDAKFFKKVAPYVAAIDTTTHTDKVYYTGQAEGVYVRGVIGCIARNETNA